ncbi:PepSY domain-containing protein [Daejeonella lutea]|uniref:Sulfite reductase (NADPH) flavoprotein alpha-component n=1 Tax=Daejeonella lutea TaxID=572036 RepID=A0A1T5BLM1_9SPHI|nr:PepSY domain-containing protein [Daejeonella lutea]SKB48172.1 sulfite reductase (NADPH) flavoprotein alpha-component [Daejeonella lutea]
MTISIWRYSHLALAVSSFIFILLASFTGIILAFDPVAQKTLPYRVNNFNQITLAEAIPAIKKAYPEVTDITVDANQFVILNGTNEQLENVTVYIDPRTGKSLGIPAEQSSFFQWVTAFHRSLFLKETGRFIIGLTSFLLLLIAVSGTILVIQRQRGVKRFFSKIVRENFAQYYHVVLGRVSLIFIIIIAFSGTYLSLARFEVIKTQQISHNIDFDSISTDNKRVPAEFPVFTKTLFADVKSIEFPFSEDPEDYYTLKLKDRELVVNQLNGDILSEIPYTQTAMLTELSLDLHTGRTNWIWALILALATVNILFFIYSGFAITLKRIANKVKNKYKAGDCRFIILVGSENGNTFFFARTIYKQLLDAGEKCYIAELNSYDTFPKAEHLIVLTATYGLGDAPVNAAKFLSRLEKIHQPKPVKFSVVGFGSHSYPDFCKFAFEVNNKLAAQEWALPLLEIHTVNDRSPDEFMQWASQWSQQAGVQLNISPAVFQVKPKRPQTLTVTGRSELSHAEGAFLITLKPSGRVKYTSGDLLAIYPANDHRERLYSIGKIGDAIQLSVKLYPGGLGSGYLNSLKPGDKIRARIDANKHFHFPNNGAPVLMISNGTGIAPFLGMIDQNKLKSSCYLYCGFRGEQSFRLYKDLLDASLRSLKLKQLQVAYSREGDKKYVKDILARDESFVASLLDDGGTIMICGSLAMQQNVIELLEDICGKVNNRDVSYFQARGQILMDCY